jgi:serine/threonine protein kinase
MSCAKAIDRKSSNNALARTSHQYVHEYRIEPHVLGSGSYSVVRAAVSEVTGAEVACKEIPHQSRAAITCITREVSALRALSPHPHIVQLCALHRDTAHTYLFLTAPRGAVTLRTYLDEHVTRVGPLSERDVRNILQQVLSAVLHCHATGVAHRDLKLENVLIVPHSMHVTLIDFGLALTEHVTAVHESLGSPLYMAPEQWRTGPHCARAADLWATGVIAHQLLFQHFPYMADSLDELQWLVTTQPYQCPTTRISTSSSGAQPVSSHLAQLLHSLLAHDPAQRISAEEALQHPWLTYSTPR